MFEPDQDGIYARVAASPARRVFAYLVLFGLGGLLVYLPVAEPPAFFWAAFMIALGIAAILMAERLRHATQHEIHLTETELRDSTGRILAQICDVKSVDRGAFAFKPSNGFTLILKTKLPRAWVPGLWWRIGKRVGVGGVTSAGQAKFMAEQIAFKLAQQQSSEHNN